MSDFTFEKGQLVVSEVAHYKHLVLFFEPVEEFPIRAAMVD